MRDNCFPEYVNFYPVMAIHAARRASRVGGGYRLYVLAKALDGEGRGAVSRERLRAFALSLGVSPRQWQRWITEARNHDLLWDVQRMSGEWHVILPSPAVAMHAMGGISVGNRKATMKAGDLIGKGWKARIWAAYEATFNGRPISRERMQKIVNVPVSTQRYRDAQAGVIRQQNHAKLQAKVGKGAARMVKEYGFGRHKGLYIRRDGHIGSRKPDSRFTDIATRAGRGRARKANATLHRMKRQDGLSQTRQALCHNVPPDTATNHSVHVRLFNSTSKQVERIEKILDRADISRDFDLFQFSHTSRNGSRVWFQC